MKSLLDAVVVLVLCVLLLLEILLSLRDKSPTFDEPNRFLPGYQYVAKGDFRLNPEHPPLVKYLVSLPLFFMSIKLPPKLDDWQGIDTQWFLAHAFLYQYNDAESIVWKSRLTVLPLTLLLAVFVFLWARDLFGRGAGLFALFLFTFEPNILAHGGLLNTDMGLACFVFLTTAGFYWLSARVTLTRVLLTGLSFGLALCTKFTSLWLIPILMALGTVRAFSRQEWVLAICGRGERSIRSSRARLGVVWAVFLAIALTGYLVLWGAYQFRYAAVGPGGDPRFTADLDRISPKKFPVGPIFELVREYQLLPEAYLFGVAHVLRKKSRKAFLLGQTGRGWWYYFFVTFFLKTPLPLIFLIGLGAIAILSSPRDPRAGPLFLLIPPLVYFAIASWSYLNIGHRHILIVYPFLFVLASAAIPWIQVKGRIVQGTVASLSVWYVISSVHVFPHYLAYFNGLVGPGNGHEYLLDSNLDWGQDLKGLKQYMDSHGIDRVWLSYFGTADPDYYGIDYNYLPGNLGFVVERNRYSGPARFLAVSATNLHGVYRDLNWAILRGKQPVARIGHSIFVYEFDHPIHISALRAPPGER